MLDVWASRLLYPTMLMQLNGHATNTSVGIVITEQRLLATVIHCQIVLVRPSQQPSHPSVVHKSQRPPSRAWCHQRSPSDTTHRHDVRQRRSTGVGAAAGQLRPPPTAHACFECDGPGSRPCFSSAEAGAPAPALLTPPAGCSGMCPNFFRNCKWNKRFSIIN